MTDDQLRTALAALGLTQAEFAALTGHHPRHVSKWVCGVHPVPVYIELIVTLLFVRERQQHEAPPC